MLIGRYEGRWASFRGAQRRQQSIGATDFVVAQLPTPLIVHTTTTTTNPILFITALGNSSINGGSGGRRVAVRRRFTAV